jgi:endoglycosylceramidase
LRSRVCLAAILCAPARAAPTLPLGHSGRWITDPGGRVVIVHGINMVYMLAPYYPAAAGFGDDDAAFLSRIGFDAVRVGVIWKAVEPRPGVYDDSYLRRIAATVRTLHRHGLLSLLDFHQDMYNERFQGEGAPDWAVQDDGLPAFPQHGFPGNYTSMPALQHAYDHFWDNSAGPGGVELQDRTRRRGVTWQRGSGEHPACSATSCSTSRSRGRRGRAASRPPAARRSTRS